MVIRVSTPRLFILRGTKRDRWRMLLVRAPAREQGTWILSCDPQNYSYGDARTTKMILCPWYGEACYTGRSCRGLLLRSAV
jgi:hypothetical protein